MPPIKTTTLPKFSFIAFLTIAELTAAGVAAILVPFPHAVDDHQTGNARFLTRAGGGILLPQGDLTPESVSLIGNYKRCQLLEMAKKARALARPDAAQVVADVCESVLKEVAPNSSGKPSVCPCPITKCWTQIRISPPWKNVWACPSL
ncbi:hypothetical protein FACS189441_8630 [Betaproteobacteria bacterium]|nr:hypothetical protein FACS189441_8630 [Betaproteobacteria bacterium]